MIQINDRLTAQDLHADVQRLWPLSASKIMSIHESAEQIGGTPVFTVDGRYVAQGWTEWTQGFQFGAALLQFDATCDTKFLEIGSEQTQRHMASHVTHFGVHDHGFNQVSTYGNLRRLILEGRCDDRRDELYACELALKASGAVQAARWTALPGGRGYIYSFNGPHSLFSDTIRSLRVLAMAHQLGHTLWGENDRRASLFDRLVQHAATTAQYNVYYGESRDIYDVRGRVVHESIFNVNDGQYRCPSTQQGYSPFSTWTRGLAWIMLGYAELLEFLQTMPDEPFEPHDGRDAVMKFMLAAATASCDFYIEQTPTCGVPYWDSGAPGLRYLDEYLERPADPYNEHEPVDSSAAAIACQGLLRLGRYLLRHGDSELGRRYQQAGLTVLRTLLQPPYLSESNDHQGLLLHSVYHRPRGWDHVPRGASIPQGESSMWGDYHLIEAALYVQRLAVQRDYTFFGIDPISAVGR